MNYSIKLMIIGLAIIIPCMASADVEIASTPFNLYKMCQSKDDQLVEWCEDYIMTVLETLQFSDKMIEKEFSTKYFNRQFCLQGIVVDEQLKLNYIKWAENHLPELKKGNMVDGVYEFFKDTFPCDNR